VIRVLGIVHRLHEMDVPPHPAGVLWRASALARQTDRVAQARLGWSHRFDQNLVLPAIAEVVLVAKARLGLWHDLVQTDEPLLTFAEIVEVATIAIDRVADLEEMEVFVVPSHHDLQHVV